MPTKELHCQKCDSPIVLDDSLVNLTSAQLNLLINKTNDENINKNNKQLLKLDPLDFIPLDRLKLYNEINSQNPQPIVIENIIDEPIEQASSLNSNHSYVMVSDSENSHKIDHDEQSKSNNEDKQNKNDKNVNSKNHIDDDPSNTISGRINTLQNIFKVLSSNQQIDHPLCLDCSNLLTENFKLKFDQTQREKDYYLTFLKKLKDRDNNISAHINLDELDSKLKNAIHEYEDLQKQESRELNELKELENTKKSLDDQLNELNHEYTMLNKNELYSVLKLKNELSLELKQKANKLEQSKSLYQMHLNNLDKLRTLNIYNRLFDISIDENDEYGTINGFRLGYKVPWSEVNAALGQIVLLLVFIIKRLELNLIDYRLIPMGSRSQIVKVSYDSDDKQQDENLASSISPNSTSASNVLSQQNVKPKPKAKSKTLLNLYSTNEFSLGKLFNFNKLDVSMIALLNILSQIESKLKDIDQEIELPYTISKKNDFIGGKSIRVTSNGEWSNSCKFLLTNLNWILAYTSAHTTPNSI